MPCTYNKRAMRKIIPYLIILAVFIPSLSKAGGFASAPSRGDGAVTRTIVIDPGHGGEDSGAVGPSGTKEKDVNLAIAKRLFNLLSKRPGVNVLLTRTDDTFVPLAERTAIANKIRADIFISIHANAASRRKAAGVETYFLSLEASDDEARRAAAFENGVIRLEKGSADKEPADDLKAILWDLTQAENLKESSKLAEIVQERLSDTIDVEPRGVKQAPFIVLVGATMPAILVEVGFITNPEEEKKLSLNTFQDKIAYSILESIESFEGLLTVKMGLLMEGDIDGALEQKAKR